jgi:hypothetical protein
VVLLRGFVLVFVVACAASCRTTTTSTPPGLSEAIVLRSNAVRAWDVIDRDGRVGFVVRFEEPGTEGRAWFSVRNPYGQELGIVDVEGRAWRYRPHQREPDWLGSGTVQAGASRILDASPGSELVEISIAHIERLIRGDPDEVVDSGA